MLEAAERMSKESAAARRPAQPSAGRGERDAIASFLELLRDERIAGWAGAGKAPPARGIERALEFWRLGH